MDNTFLKPSVIARTAIGLLFRELVVARTIWTDAVDPGEFAGALNDTVNMRVPARRTARTRTLRGGTPITNDESVEFAVPVKLGTDVYNGAPITDEELTLDISNFGLQILLPQIQSVAEGIEDIAASAITGATYDEVLDIDDADPYLTLVDARKKLNDSNVPKASRSLLVGSAVEALLLKSDRFVKVDNAGAAAVDAFTEAQIGRIAGFNVFQANAIPEDEAYAYHRTAYVLAARAPRVPQGVSSGETRTVDEAGAVQMGAAASFGGVGCRWIMDYDYTTTTDRSLVNSWVGTAVVEDADDPTDPDSTTSLVRGVKLAVSGS
ncbi:MAG TPA: hypothetical protein VGA36_09620 [Nitriliruptorales bacterium]